MRKIIIPIIIISLLTMACSPIGPQDMVGGDTDIHGCKGSAGYEWCDLKQKCLREWEEPCNEVPGSVLSAEEAEVIAKDSICATKGNITGGFMYNPHTRTWWFDTDIKQEGCSPACVVFEDTSNALLNWRCTGLIEPTQPEITIESVPIDEMPPIPDEVQFNEEVIPKEDTGLQ